MSESLESNRLSSRNVVYIHFSSSGMTANECKWLNLRCDTNCTRNIVICNRHHIHLYALSILSQLAVSLTKAFMFHDQNPNGQTTYYFNSFVCKHMRKFQAECQSLTVT